MTPERPFVPDSAIFAEGSAQDDKPRPLGEGGRAALDGTAGWRPRAAQPRRRAAGYLPAAALRPARRPNDMAMEWLAPATVTG